MKPMRPEDCDTLELRVQLEGGCSLRDAVEGPRERRTSRQKTIGSVRVREHCEFGWAQDDGDTRRIVQIDRGHCRACINELAAMVGSDLVIDRRG